MMKISGACNERGGIRMMPPRRAPRADRIVTAALSRGRQHAAPSMSWNATPAPRTGRDANHRRVMRLGYG